MNLKEVTMNHVNRSTDIWLGLFVLLFAGTVQAEILNPLVSNCTIISQPGSYTVINNITATPSNVKPLPGTSGAYACILITADFVTLNLNGFSITGSNLGSTPASGISTDVVEHTGIYVHSGTVANFSQAWGIELLGNGHTVEHIRAVMNGSGIAAFSLLGASGVNGHRIVSNTAVSNVGGGILVYCPAVVLENAVAGNGPFQIEIAGGCLSGVQNSPAP